MRILSFVAVTALLTGCVSKQEYPTEWTQVSPSNFDCPMISGTYSSIGELKDNSYSPSLNTILNIHGLADSLAIHADDKKLTITPYKNALEISTIEIAIPKESIYCEDGYLVFEEEQNYNQGGALAQEWHTYYLTTNAEGLVIKQRQSTLGMLFFVPIASSETSWILFRNTLSSL